MRRAAGVCPRKDSLIMSRSSLAILIAGPACSSCRLRMAQSNDRPLACACRAAAPERLRQLSLPATAPGAHPPIAPPTRQTIAPTTPVNPWLIRASVRLNGRRRVRLEADDLRLRRSRRNVGLHPELQRRIEQQRHCSSHDAGRSQPAPASHHSKQPARIQGRISRIPRHSPIGRARVRPVWQSAKHQIAVGDRPGWHRAQVPRPKPRISTTAAFPRSARVLEDRG